MPEEIVTRILRLPGYAAPSEPVANKLPSLSSTSRRRGTARCPRRSPERSGGDGREEGRGSAVESESPRPTSFAGGGSLRKSNCQVPDKFAPIRVTFAAAKSYEIRGLQSPTTCGTPFACAEVGEKPYAKPRATDHSDGRAPPVSAG